MRANVALSTQSHGFLTPSRLQRDYDATLFSVFINNLFFHRCAVASSREAFFSHATPLRRYVIFLSVFSKQLIISALRRCAVA
jgi:hypothetical protein